MKKIDSYILKAFSGPFMVTFFITLFILLMQFLWKYIDDLVGKGLEWYLVAELLFYASANMVPLALPLAVLLSSLMTFGNLGERFELAAFKAAGISMFRFMGAAILGACIITVSAFLFSNYVLPHASLKFWTTLIDVTQQRPALNIKPNVFYHDIDNYSILISEKEEDNLHVRDITIYDKTTNKSNSNVLVAERAKMYSDEETQALVMRLYNGKQYQQLKNNPKAEKGKEHMRMTFTEWEKALDISGFQMTRTSEDMYKNHYRMLNLAQLNSASDSIRDATRKRMESLEPVMSSYFFFNRDSLAVEEVEATPIKGRFVDELSQEAAQASLRRSLVAARNVQSFTRQIKDNVAFAEDRIVQHDVEWHRKITMAMACLVFMFIGAPLGAIIRKGGFGMPVLTAVVIFIIFYVMNIMGEKFADQGIWSAWFGMWFPLIVLTPFSIFLTIKAKNDSPIFMS